MKRVIQRANKTGKQKKTCKKTNRNKALFCIELNLALKRINI